MGGYENGSLSERVERLEREAKALRSELEYTLRSAVPPVVEKRANTRKSGPTATRSTTPTPFPETATDSRSGSLEQDAPLSGRSFSVPLDLGNLSSGEWRLNMIGIGLLLFGVAFLFMFSVQRGWISAPMRAGLGLAFGVALLAIGLRVYDKRWVLPPLPLASEFRERLVTPT